MLGAANIAVQKVIPAMQAGAFCEITAIASRNLAKAQEAASKTGIRNAYGSYEELLQNPEIEAVYIPLPNHLHVEWAEKALESGKHVLCEKPVAMNVAEAERLQETSLRNPQLKLMEAFMYRFHPQWQEAKQLVDSGAIGTLRTIQAFFSYYNVNKENIRNIKAAGGGALMDIGCYCISQSRFIFGVEPFRVHGIVDYDPSTQTDRLTSGTLDFGNGTATFTCSTQLNPFQRFHIFGTEGSLEIEIPVNAAPDQAARILLHKAGNPTKEISFEPVNQYTLQGDLFSKAIIENTEVPTPFLDAINNMKVIEAVLESNRDSKWVNII